MATTKYPTLRPELITGDLTVEIWPDEFAAYIGTRAQLEAEGLIPDGLVWPRAAIDKHWQADGFDYWLRRVRPDGFKGPMRAWLELDNWFVRVMVTGRDHHWRNERQIEKKREELIAEIFRQSPFAQRKWHEQYSALCAARNDAAYQQFKSQFVPERRKPGRPSKRDRAQATE